MKISDLVEQDTGDKIGLPGETPPLAGAEVVEQPRPSLNLAWLRTPTGDGSVDDYLDHPLNFARSRGLAQALRGGTGLLGDLRLAIVDIALGMLQFAKERSAAHASNQAVDPAAR